jgi:hypothetical protein
VTKGISVARSHAHPRLKNLPSLQALEPRSEAEHLTVDHPLVKEYFELLAANQAAAAAPVPSSKSPLTADTAKNAHFKTNTSRRRAAHGQEQ